MDTTKQTVLEEDLKRKIEDYLQRFKEKTIAKLSHCTKCRRKGHLRWHGKYQRRIITTTTIYETLPIKRLLCLACHKSFGLLPSFVEKFHHYAKAVIHFALKLIKTLSLNNAAEFFTANIDCPLAPLTLYLWRRKFA